jgi:5-oxoprolinase (ATP-hydrolysing)
MLLYRTIRVWWDTSSGYNCRDTCFQRGQYYLYVASRAHHADIGGILPDLCLPTHELYQEGAAIKSEKLVSEGKFNEKRITELLYDEPAQHPGSSGTRCLADNINDLKAQIAANQRV